MFNQYNGQTTILSKKIWTMSALFTAVLIISGIGVAGYILVRGMTAFENYTEKEHKMHVADFIGMVLSIIFFSAIGIGGVALVFTGVYYNSTIVVMIGFIICGAGFGLTYVMLPERRR